MVACASSIELGHDATFPAFEFGAAVCLTG
jgi:hypothetical protein